MKPISVPDMMCENCVRRITEALTKENLKFEVSLEKKNVTVGGDERAVKTAIGELEDLGFTPDAV